MSLYVYLAALQRSAESWEEQREVVRGGRKSLGEVDASLLGARVQPAAQAFIDAWMQEVKRLEDAAGDHADALRDASLLFQQSEQDVIERSQRLMAWTDRTASPAGRLG
jgi:hypothetical protein